MTATPFDAVDYFFLGSATLAFVLCVWVIWRGKPYRQTERKAVEPKEVTID